MFAVWWDFNDSFIANFLPSVPVKEFGKSVENRLRYRYGLVYRVSLFWNTVYAAYFIVKQGRWSRDQCLHMKALYGGSRQVGWVGYGAVSQVKNRSKLLSIPRCLCMRTAQRRSAVKRHLAN